MLNAHIELALAQRQQKTLLCPGPCPHIFDGMEANKTVYGFVEKGEEFEFYEQLLALTNMKDPENRCSVAGIMAAAEIYTKRMLDIWIRICGFRTFKDQDGVFQRWGPPGDFMMMRIVDHVRSIEKELDIRIIYQHDCKRNDLGATMIGYLERFLGNLEGILGVKHAYLRYDTMNINVYMGKDVAVLEEVQKKNFIPARGLELMRDHGKGIVVLCKTSNDSGPDYQQLYAPARGMTLENCIAGDVHAWVEKHGLVTDGLSTMGLVVGSTHKAISMIRTLAPTETLWVPGFGNQGGKFENIMLELISDGKWNGQGAIFTNETGTMYAHLENFGGTGNPADMEKRALQVKDEFQKAEYEAYETPEVKAVGIRYPF